MKKIVIPTISLFIICMVTALLLALTNNATSGKIEQLAIDNAIKSQSAVLEGATEFEEKIVEHDGKEYTCQIATDGSGKLVGYVVTASANGYGGVIKIMYGISPDGEIVGNEILEISETAGLGMNATSKSFTEQFVGLKEGIAVVKGTANGNEIAAITGATITSQACTNAANQALAVYKVLVGGGK